VNRLPHLRYLLNRPPVILFLFLLCPRFDSRDNLRTKSADSADSLIDDSHAPTLRPASKRLARGRAHPTIRFIFPARRSSRCEIINAIKPLPKDVEKEILGHSYRLQKFLPEPENSDLTIRSTSIALKIQSLHSTKHFRRGTFWNRATSSPLSAMFGLIDWTPRHSSKNLVHFECSGRSSCSGSSPQSPASRRTSRKILWSRATPFFPPT
jgi:hypothetical protein